MYKYIILWLLVGSFFPTARAQTYFSPGWRSALLLDDLANPGLRIGAEMPLSQWEKKGKTRLYLAALDLIFYHERYSHYGFALLPQIGYRRIRARGGKRELTLGLGYHRSFLDAPAYRVGPEGQITRGRLAGQHTMLTEFTYAVGKDYRFKDLPLSWQLGLGFNARYPVNGGVSPGLHLQAGLNWYFQGFHSVSTTSKKQ